MPAASLRLQPCAVAGIRELRVCETAADFDLKLTQAPLKATNLELAMATRGLCRHAASGRSFVLKARSAVQRQLL
jgi:hypothetical protein